MYYHIQLSKIRILPIVPVSFYKQRKNPASSLTSSCHLTFSYLSLVGNSTSVCLRISWHWPFSKVQISYFAVSFYLGLSNIHIFIFKLCTFGRNVAERMLHLSCCIISEVRWWCWYGWAFTGDVNCLFVLSGIDTVFPLQDYYFLFVMNNYLVGRYFETVWNCLETFMH